MVWALVVVVVAAVVVVVVEGVVDAGNVADIVGVSAGEGSVDSHSDKMSCLNFADVQTPGVAALVASNETHDCR